MKLYYFNCYGRGEPIRMLLTYAHVPFEDITFDFKGFSDWKKKGFFEFDQVPVLEIDGEHFSQSYAIQRMLGKTYGFYP